MFLAVNGQNESTSKSPKNNFYLCLGPGIFSGKEKSGFSFYSGVVWSREFTSDENGATKTGNFNLKLRGLKMITSGNENTSGRRLRSFDLLIGTTFGKHFQFNMAGGIGIGEDSEWVIVYNNNPYIIPQGYNRYFYEPNFPLELSIRVVPAKYVGISFCTFLNLNSTNSTYGFNFKILFGRIY